MMTLSGTSFDFQLNGANTSQLGIYTVTGYCGDGYNKQSFAYTFEVTTTGKDNSISLWVMLVLLIFSVVLLMIAFALDNIYIAFLSGVLWIVSGLLVYLYGFGNVSDMYTNAIAMIIMAIGIMIFFAAAFHHDSGEGISKAFGLDKEDEEEDYDYFKSSKNKD
jgi:hypothetical protein